jgi:chorismate mutase
MLDANGVTGDDLISMLFTVTDDITSVFPAEAVRRMGLGSVPLMCAREIPVAGSMPLVVRVLMHMHTDRSLDQIRPVYLDGAESLRDDLD